jgi:CRP/FNR family transcriptional regulator
MDISDDLRAIPCFNELTESESQAIALLCEDVVGREGDRLLVQGDRVDHLQFLIQGKASVLRHIGDEQRIVGFIGPGGVLGELALLDHGPASATVQAMQPYRLLRFCLTDLKDAFERQPRLGYKVIARLARQTSLRRRLMVGKVSFHSAPLELSLPPQSADHHRD